MFVKTLALKGFKSFAEPTTLELEPGITVVVGPNGSGKSNVVDAVAWVLGAQGPRTLRSSKMEDVIFAGTGRRQALGRAEVSLTIDNASGRLPLEVAEVTITRTLWRSGESEYAINGTPCRLLDVQELLSDSGVGRQQHIIVGQGQLDAVLNARPEDRRLIVEEAAGVLKYRRRRERTERRLAATESDLSRLQDLLREVRRQMRPLERQAEAARRHDALVVEHRALRLHLAGRELADADDKVSAVTAERAELAEQAEELGRRLAGVDQELEAAEAAVAANRVDDLNQTIGALEGLAERSRGLGAVLLERQRSVEASLAAAVDATVVASLESESATVAQELEEVESEAGDVATGLSDLRSQEQALAEERTRVEELQGQADGEDAGSAGAQEAPEGVSPAPELRGRLGALRHALDRDREELARTEAAVATLDRRQQELADQMAARRAERAEAEGERPRLVAAVEEAEAERRGAEAAVATATEALHAAEAARQGWVARAEALALALDQVRAQGGADHLGGMAGQLGTLAELVEVDEGWEAAFEAAAAELQAAVVVAGYREAVAALERLEADRVAGCVLAAVDTRGSAVDRSQAPGATPLLDHVRATTPVVAGLLDLLFARALVVDGGWRGALEVAQAHPAATVVTRQGDCLGPRGWRVGAPGPGATGAALAEAEAESAAAAEALEEARSHQAGARASLERARIAASEAAKALEGNDESLGAATHALQRVEQDHAGVGAEARAAGDHLGELRGRVERGEAEVAEVDRWLPLAERAEAEAAQRARRAEEVSRDFDQREAALADRRRALEVREATVAGRRDLLTRRRAQVEERLARTVEARREAAARRTTLERTARVIRALAGVVRGCGASVEAELEARREDRRRRLAVVEDRTAAIGRLRQERAGGEAALADVRDRAQRAEVHLAEVRLRRESAEEAVRRDLEASPETAVATPCPELPAGTSATQRAAELDRELRALGPVNPLAVSELQELEERSSFLEGQLEDVRSARRELSKVLRAVDAEILEVFSAAYADVSRHFSDLVETLFPGGVGELSLTDPENPLETGIEVSARPSGKQVRKLSLLSGGERSLVALAFLCAVFRSRPSPFYLLDEVEAALDDVNLRRFLTLMKEFRAEAQLVIVTHQKRTMEVADSLYGVSMQPGGSSMVVSERARVQAAG